MRPIPDFTVGGKIPSWCAKRKPSNDSGWLLVAQGFDRVEPGGGFGRVKPEYDADRA